MKTKIGINGLGRIGRMILRSVFEENHKELQIKHINNRTNIDRTTILPILPKPFIPILVFISFSLFFVQYFQHLIQSVYKYLYKVRSYQNYLFLNLIHWFLYIFSNN